ncbi:peroxidasin-like isoform X2 [Gigantopelta aegis]|nr:peroxidasin-like isoform X2 [Gigantopelta aegis]
MRRFVKPLYDDGVSFPRARGRNGGVLPSPRFVSSMLHASRQPIPDDEFVTHMVMQWGQFLDHDITSTPVHRGLSGSAVTCCVDDLVPANLSQAILNNLRHRDICFPIAVPRNDHRFGHRSCLNFVRSIQVANADCSDVPVEQLNQLTAYVDGSQIYGSTEEEEKSLRTGMNGQLKSSRDGLLPREEKEICEMDRPGAFCFKAGDERVNEQMGLTTMHTTWMRQHNRIAADLQTLNPHWDDEHVFQETRRIVGAMLQHITYHEFMPSVFGQSDMKAWGLTSPSWGFHDVYDPEVDASIRNGFATAAFRFGHSLVRSFMSHYTRDYQFDGDSLLQHIFGNTSVILSNHNRINTFLRGLSVDRASKMDRFLSSQILDHLFEDKKGDALDLAALNIQRGRDHGLPGYNHWRQMCKLTVATTFDPDQPNGLVDHPYEDAEILSSLYRHPDDIDLFPGAISERPVPGGLVGPTVTCILGKQFAFLKTGDRFWYERKNEDTGFTLEQLNSIKSVSLARVMCDNSNIEKIQAHVFWRIGMDERYMNPVVGCWSLPALDLTLWKDNGAYWSNWSEWSPCFASFRHRSRTCPNEVTMCDGPNTQFKKCSKQSCDKFVTPEDRFNCLMNIADIFDFKK